MLERIAGQVDHVRPGLTQRREVRKVADHIGAGQCFSDLPPVVGGPTHRRDHPRGSSRVRPGPQRGGGQQWLGADLDKNFAAEFGQGGHPGSEFHGLAGMLAPVTGIESNAAADSRSGAVADQQAFGGAELESGGVGIEFIEYWIKQRRVKGVAGLQPVAADALAGQSGNNDVEVGGRAGQDGARSVASGHRQRREFPGDGRDAIGIGEDRSHPAALRQAVEQPAAFSHQQCAVFEAEDTGDAGRGVLPDAVTKEHIRFESPGLPQPS